MRKKKLLIVTQLYPYPGNIFLGTFVTQQLQLLKDSFDITVFTVIPESVKLAHPTLSTDVVENGVRVIRISYFPIWLNIFGVLKFPYAIHLSINKNIIHRRLLRMAKRLHAQEPFDLVHGHETYIGDEAGPIGRLLGIPSIFTLHSFYNYHQDVFGTFATRMALKNLLLCDRYIAVSSIAAKSYIQEGLPSGRFSIIPNGIAANQTSPPNQRMIDFARGRKILLSVGYLGTIKRFNISIQALARLPATNTILVIAGIGPDRKKLENLSHQLQCADRLLWLDAIAPVEMPAVYEAADLVIHPSVVDSFSMVCLEAMSHGKVVICNTRIGICEFTRNHENILIVPPDDVDAIINAAQRILNDAKEYRRISTNARTFSTTMTWEHQVGSIIQVYDSVGNSPHE